MTRTFGVPANGSATPTWTTRVEGDIAIISAVVGSDSPPG